MRTLLTMLVLSGCGPGDALPVSRLVAPHQVDVDGFILGESNYFEVVVYNTGTRATEIDAEVVPPFALTMHHLTVDAHSSAVLKLHYQASSYADQSGRLSVQGSHNRVEVLLHATVLTDADLDGHVATAAGGDDCDDRRPDVHPGSVEVCDGVDQDCDAEVDEDAVDAPRWYLDEDGDGWGRDADPVVQCAQPPDHVGRSGDCDDSRPAIHPEAEDPCYDGVDQDCDGWSDLDCDRDGYDARLFGGDDCNDRSADIHPGAEEIWYDGEDQDCSGGSDFDHDGDGWDSPSGGGEDCNDLDAATYPGAPERDDGRDEDCDGWIDEDFVLDGDLLITEIMVDPSALDDDKGQYVEITNLSSRDIHLDGLSLTSHAGVSVVESGVLTPDESALLCASTTPADNGGMVCAEALPGLLEGSDSVLIGLDQDLDEVDWTGWEIPTGASWELALDSTSMTSSDNDDASSWCVSTQEMSSGDLGSPGDTSAHCQ